MAMAKNVVRSIDGVSYEEWFGREPGSASEFGDLLRSFSEALRGEWLTAVRGNSEQGFCSLFFEKTGLAVWFGGGDRCKLRHSSQDSFGKDENFIEQCRQVFGKSLLAIYPGGRNASRSIIFLFGDKMMDSEHRKKKHETTKAVSLRLSYNEKEKRFVFTVDTVDVRDGIYGVMSTEKIPMTQDSYKQRVRNFQDGQMYEGLVDVAGKVKIPPVYRYIHLADFTRELYQVSVMSGDGQLLVGACAADGRLLIPCQYRDLYCLKVGYAMVMDQNNHFWVIDYDDNAIFGPSIYGVDIYGNSDKYLFYIEYREDVGFECMGIYDVASKTMTAPAEYSYIKYRDDGMFDVVVARDRRRAVVDRFGNEQDLLFSQRNFKKR